MRGCQMRFVSYGLLALLALLAGAGAFVYVALPTDFVRDELVSLVRTHTGRSLIVAGPVSLTFYPDFAVELHDVSLSSPPGMSGEALISMRSLALKMPFWPLLQHKLRIDKFVLDQPIVVLRTDKDGRRSWDFATETAPAASAPVPVLRGGQTNDAAAPDSTLPAPAASPEVTKASVAGLDGLELPDISITGGTIRLIDDRSGLKEDLTAVSLKVRLENLAGPVVTDGTVTWSGEALAVNMVAEPASNLLASEPAKIAFSAKGRLLEMALKGRFAPLDPSPLSGRLDVKADAPRDLLRWLHHPLPSGPDLGPITFVADVSTQGRGFKALNMVATLNGATAKGSVSMEQGKSKPVLHATLAIDRLDFDALGTTTSAQATPVPVKPGAAAVPSEPATAKDSSKASSPAPVTADPGGGWSTTPIDLAALRSVDGDVALTLGSLKFHNIKFGRTAATSTIKDGVLRTRFSEMQLYDGKGAGTLVVDAHAAQAVKIETSFSLRGVQAQPFLTDAASFGHIAGRGDITFGFTGTGRNQRDIVNTLMGQGRIELADGAIVGTDIAKIVRSLQKGKFNGWQDEPSAKTDFSSLTASCTVTNGVAANDDLALQGPLLRLTGAGKASLPAMTLDYTAQPTIVATLEGQGATAEASGPLTGIAIPVRITGPWAKPNVSVDLAAIAKNPQAVLDTVKKALGNVKGGSQVQDAIGKLAGSKEGKAIGDLLGGLLGKGAAPADQPAQ